MKKIFLFFVVYMFFVSSVLAKDIRFVQVTDVRFSKDGDDTLERVVKDINQQKGVEFVVFTGDNIRRPNKDDLEAFLKEAKKLHVPFYVVIGDKDVNKRKELSKKEYSLFVKKHVKKYKPETPNYVFEKNGLVFMVVDGAKDVIPISSGYYKDDVVDWVDANLDLYKKKNVIIFQHFPLIPPAQKESYYTYNPEPYLAVLKKHNNVKAIISGHFGVNKEETSDGILHISTAPAPQYRVIDVLDYNTPNFSIWAQVKEAR